MKVFLAGASGVIGHELVPALVQAGHEVTGATRSAERAAALRCAGAQAVVLDALDEAAVGAALAAAEPEVVINQLTSIPARIDPRRIERDFAANDRLRAEGTRILVAAAQSAGARRVISQSISFTYAPGPPGALHREEDPLLSGEQAPRPYRRSAAAVVSLERTTLDAGGVVLRYGYFYGGGSAISRTGTVVADLRRRRLPIIGGGTGVWSFIHLQDAASATIAALSAGTDGAAYNVVDDEPARVADWIRRLAEVAGAPKPMSIPAWLARPAAGAYGVVVMTQAQGAVNERAKRELGWTPAHPSWREGFATALG